MVYKEVRFSSNAARKQKRIALTVPLSLLGARSRLPIDCITHAARDEQDSSNENYENICDTVLDQRDWDLPSDVERADSTSDFVEQILLTSLRIVSHHVVSIFKTFNAWMLFECTRDIV